jgi:hypothetical protein
LQAGRSNPPVNRWWYAGALAMGWAFYWVFHALFLEWGFNLRDTGSFQSLVFGARYTNATLAALLIFSLLAMRSRRLDRAGSRGRKAALLIVFLIFSLLFVQTWKQYRRSAWFLVEDVGRTTIAADRALLRGINPYAAPIDRTDVRMGAMRFDGYKYLPVTMAAYLPGALAIRQPSEAVVATNLVLGFLAAAALAAVAWREISLDAAICAAALMFMSEIIVFELVVFGSNDVVPMLLLTLALCFVESRFACGLLVGLSISAKLVPGLLWIPILLTPRAPRRYAAGVLAGLIPCLPFFLWGPGDMTKNIIIFLAARHWEMTAPLYSTPPLVRAAAQGVVAAFWLAIAIRSARIPMNRIHRCAWAAALTLAFQLAAPNMHQNYFIWWHMPVCVLATSLIFNPAGYEWIGRVG